MDSLLNMDGLVPLALLLATREDGGASAGDDSSLKNEPSRCAERRPLLLQSEERLLPLVLLVAAR